LNTCSWHGWWSFKLCILECFLEDWLHCEAFY